MRYVLMKSVLWALIFLFSGCSDYTEYVPIVLVVEGGNHGLRENHELSTPEHLDAMKVILDSYDEPYKVVNGKLYIMKSLQKNRDLLQNYTAKAEAFRNGEGIPGRAIPVPPE